MEEQAAQTQYVTVGKLGSTHGVRGWIRLNSFTQPATSIFDYQPWLLKRSRSRFEPVKVIKWRNSSKGPLLLLEGVENRETAQLLVNSEIVVAREQLPQSTSDDVLWCDLIGCSVVTTAGQELGAVTSMIETGANDVMVVGAGGQHLVPYVPGVWVHDVNLQEKRVVVDWDPEF